MSSMNFAKLASRPLVMAAALPILAISANCHATEPSANQLASNGQMQISIDANLDGDGRKWEQYRQQTLARNNGDNINGVIGQWRELAGSDNYSFSSYASFLVTHAGWPDESRFRRNAEQAIDLNSYNPGQVIAFFEKFPPLTNAGKARYAIALWNQAERAKAIEMARHAWRGGPLPEDDEQRLIAKFARDFSVADHDARMDALLWAGARSSAERQLVYSSPERRPAFAARLGNMSGGTGQYALGTDALRDAGYVASRAIELREQGNSYAARQYLANRPILTHRPANPEKWYEILLSNARAADNDRQYQLAYDIASKVDDAFAPGTDISAESLGVRDDYTSLTWLAGTAALYQLGKPGDAVEMFARYGNAARTPQTRSKGFYWAGRAAQASGDNGKAQSWYGQAGQYPDHFYGQLALEALGQKLPVFSERVAANIDQGAYQGFYASSLVKAIEEISKSNDWRTQVRFFRALADNAESEAEHLMVMEFAHKIGRRDLAVITGLAARGEGIDSLQILAFPQVPVPPGYQTKWTFIQAISRQESQFAQYAISHAGARGLMQLMPATAREQAGKMGLGYSYGGLLDDTNYNVRLGSGYFERMLDYYGGAYPLAVAAYNAGPGNVNKWLRANGDPRTGEIDILRWIEEIPIYETKNYVQRVLENAVMYDHMRPEKAHIKGENKLSRYLGKANPG